MRDNPLAVVGLILSIFGWALIWLFPYAVICWLLGAAFSNTGQRRAARYNLPHLRLGWASITISTLPVVVFTVILIYANLT